MHLSYWLIDWNAIYNLHSKAYGELLNYWVPIWKCLHEIMSSAIVVFSLMDDCLQHKLSGWCVNSEQAFN